jgi:ubiquinone/menaquinone biosynthesis C-methylase UbiE
MANEPKPLSRELIERNERIRRSWDEQAPHYDKSMSFVERRLFGSEHRPWVGSRATGRTLEVAIGTGLNLEHFSGDVILTGLDLSQEMLTIARAKTMALLLDVELRQGDAHRLPFDDASFDSVVCTYSLCNIPDPRLAVAEMRRVLVPGGKLILLDHIRSSVAPILWIQRAIEFITARNGEYMTRRPLEYVVAQGFDLKERDRLRLGVIERLVAVKT